MLRSLVGSEMCIRDRLSPLQSAVAGAAAGAAGRSIVSPLNRVVILYQVDPNRPFTLRAAFKTLSVITKNTGVRGLWRGNGVAMVRVIPHSTIVFTSFPIYQQHLMELADNGHSDVIVWFTAGAAAGATASMLTYPLDLMKTRISAHWSLKPRYDSYSSGLLEIIQAEGYRGLFRGLFPTLVGIIPYAGISFATFHTLKDQYTHWSKLDHDRQIPVGVRLVAGGVAGTIAQTVTYPLNVLKRRMQVSQGKRSVWEHVLMVWKNEGRRGFFKGISITYLKAPIGVALSFTLNDFFRGLMSYESNDLQEAEKLTAQGTAMTATETYIPGPGGKRHPTLDHLTAPHKLTQVENLLAGGVAGAAAKTVIAPADRIKILYQVNPHREFSFRAAIKTAQTIISHRWTNLWKGNNANLARVFPYAAVTYASFDWYRELLEQRVGMSQGKQTSFMAGAGAGFTAVTATYPLDLLRARIAANWGAEHTHSTEGLGRGWA
eukprot:TRINITY_DN6641_c0_g1_i5.p1 TRINITY_DN6641_c0_g1~~TRINITY_DN6641_c0_g1_i5.p1  ORF type:complete len:490 (-),score=82.54 TRINITY_DN6641_c0_g1_i5:418-1887(-)